MELDLISVLSFAALLSAILASQPDYDHQTTTYNAPFKPLHVKNTPTSVTPFFSPDHSIEELLKILQMAKEKIDISIPSMSSWEGCTYPDPGESCIGCTAQYLIEKESFPIFQALNNALHNGIKVNILTNDFGDTLCKGKMDLLTYLQLAGADVRYFTTVTFTHSKYMAIDDEIAVVSSINYSKTSIMANREAGLVLRNSTGTKNQLADFTQSVFHYDFEHAYTKDLPHYSKEDLQRIKDAKHIDVNHPDPYHFHECNVTSVEPEPISDRMDVSIATSPDHAYDTIIHDYLNAKQSLSISIYQITDDNFCNGLIKLKQSNPGVDLKVFVSNDIYGKGDQHLALRCYNHLFENNIVVKMSHEKCLRYSHEKFWIIDGDVVFMSTGNLSDSDYPTAPYVFPPYGDKGWRKVNRDYTIRIANSPRVIARFQRVFDTDYSQGFDYTPSKVN